MRFRSAALVAMYGCGPYAELELQVWRRLIVADLGGAHGLGGNMLVGKRFWKRARHGFGKEAERATRPHIRPLLALRASLGVGKAGENWESEYPTGGS